MAVKTPKFNWVDALFIGLLLVVFGGIVLHAPLSVALGTAFPAIDVPIKAWKEAAMGIALIVGAVVLTRRQAWHILKSPLVLLIAAYGVLHLLLLPVNWQSPTVALAGLLIDLRYPLFFVLIYTAIMLYPRWRRRFIAVFTAGALIVVGFALLQATVLPADVLKYLGYGESTIMPYLTVDENPDFVRINSTLRGPNPLGAYAVVVLSLLIAFGLKGRHAQFKRPMFIVAVLGIGSLVALWASYSRSALVAAIVAIAVLLIVTARRRLPKWAWAIFAVAALAIGGTLYAARDSYVVSNVLLHENDTTGANISSNEGHIDSLNTGLERLVSQPLGGGIGSTGSASLFGDRPIVIENQYLFVAHEVGWLGLGLFLYIFWKVMAGLWRGRQDWLALGTFASGIGLALIGLLLPVWVDDTVALVWWGLAAIAIGGSHGRSVHKTTKRTA